MTPPSALQTMVVVTTTKSGSSPAHLRIREANVRLESALAKRPDFGRRTDSTTTVIDGALHCTTVVGGHPIVADLVGEHLRMPRTVRGRDTFWRLDAVGVLDERHDQIEDLARARALSSLPPVGSDEGRSIDLDTLHRLGVAVVGRIGGIVDGIIKCSGGLANACAVADLKLARLLDRFDNWTASTGAAVSSPDRPAPTKVTSSALEVDVRHSVTGTVIFATGMRPDYPWLQIPALDRRGRIAHAGGVITSSPGAYAIGQSILRRHRSSYLSGATSDSAAGTLR